MVTPSEHGRHSMLLFTSSKVIPERCIASSPSITPMSVYLSSMSELQLFGAVEQTVILHIREDDIVTLELIILVQEPSHDPPALAVAGAGDDGSSKPLDSMIETHVSLP